MTEHSTKELERQVQQARSKLDLAGRDLHEAEKRLHQRRCEESGLLGKYATSNGRTVRISSLMFYNDDKVRSYRGPRILKNGGYGQHIELYNFSGVTISDEAPAAGDA